MAFFFGGMNVLENMESSNGRTGAEKERLELYVPCREDGWFYVRLMSDPATMSYNSPWFPPDGCIPDPESGWNDILSGWIGREPERFYAFLRRKPDGAFVGDVNYHRNHELDRHDMGIVIFAQERGKGYGKQGLRLLLDKALLTDGIHLLHNDFENSRTAACRIHRDCGFRDTGVTNGMIGFDITREEYRSTIPEDGRGIGTGLQTRV